MSEKELNEIQTKIVLLEKDAKTVGSKFIED